MGCEMARFTAVLFLICLVVGGEGRVTFDHAEVLDTVDLKGVVAASFRCNGGCRVFSPTKNANIVIIDPAGKVGNSLMDLSNLKPGTFYELPGGTGYKLKNTGLPDPSFVFYTVEKAAPNYGTKVTYLNSATTTKVTATQQSMLTVLSDSGVVRVYDFDGDYSKGLPTVHATGFDSISNCRPVYTASNSETLKNTLVPVFGPIATIDLKSTTGSKSFMISGSTLGNPSIAVGSSAVFISPGYVGCSSTGNSLYSLHPSISFDSSFHQSDSNGLKATVSADYSIDKEADAIELTINNEVQKLWKKGSIPNKVYTSNSFDIKVVWTNKDPTDRFALQVDVTSNGGNSPGGVQTTTKSVSVISFVSSVLAVVFYMLR